MRSAFTYCCLGSICCLWKWEFHGAVECWGSHESLCLSSPLLPVSQGLLTMVTCSDAVSCSLSLTAIRPEGKNNRLFVFSISMSSVSRLSLDVAADTHEDLLDWVKKIREAAQTADARVSLGSPWQGRRHLLGLQLLGFPGVRSW